MDYSPPRGVLALHEPKTSLRDLTDDLAAVLARLESAAIERLACEDTTVRDVQATTARTSP